MGTSNVYLKDDTSRIKSREQLFQQAVKAAQVHAFTPPWPDRLTSERGGGYAKARPWPFNYLGCLVNSGRCLAFCVRGWSAADSFPVHDPEHLSERERDALMGVGRAGGVAGLVIAATASAIDQIYWLPWNALADVKAIDWGDDRLIEIGNPGFLNRRAGGYQIDFADVIRIPRKRWPVA